MTPLLNPNLLVSTCTTETNITLDPSKTEDPNTQTINAVTCSEFKTITLPVAHFDANQSLHFVFDGDQQPLIFTVGADSRLYCLRHVSGQSWNTLDITPVTTDTSVTAFHLAQHDDKKVAIAVAIPSSSTTGSSDLYYAAPFDPTKSDFDPSQISFTQIKNDNAILISTLTVSAANHQANSWIIIAGTAGTDSKVATEYVVSPDDSTWRTLTLQQDATVVMKGLAVTLKRYGGLATLYKTDSSDDTTDADVGTAASCTSTDKDQSLDYTLLLDKIGNGARDIAATTTTLGVSDIYVAGLAGIGYYVGQFLGNEPTVILPDISFQQITAVEKPVGDGGASTISVLAVSTAGDLYHIMGTRTSSSVSPTFSASSAPMRRSIGFFTSQVNGSSGATEAVYVGTNDSQLRHIVQDPSASLWADHAVHVHWDEENYTTYNSFETHITLKGSLNASINQEYPLSVSSSQLVYALVNDKSYRIGPDPISISTDNNGRMRVVTQADLSISSPLLQFTVADSTTDDDSSYTVKVEPRQRVTQAWSRYTSGSDLKNATSTTGEAIFPDTTIADSTFDDVVTTLQKITNILNNPNDDGTYGSTSDSSSSASLGARPAPHSMMVAPSFGDWLDGVAESVEDYLGDAVEAVVSTVEEAATDLVDTAKQVVTIGVSVVEGVLNFVATIAGTSYRWILKEGGAIIRSVIGCLKSTLGLDSTRFFALFGFGWDHEDIIKTQQIISKSATDGINVLKDIVTNNAVAFKDAINTCDSGVSTFIKDYRVPDGTQQIDWNTPSSFDQDSDPGKFLSTYFHNPVIQEILAYAVKWMGKLSSLVDDVLTLPGAKTITDLINDFYTAVSNLVVQEVDNVVLLVNDVIDKVKKIFSGDLSLGDFLVELLSDAFWTVFDALKDVANTFVDLLSPLLGALVDMCTGAIDIPGISAFWKAFNGCDFTILNVVSMQVAQILYLFTMLWDGKLPFDVWQPWYDLLPNASDINLTQLSTLLDSSSSSSSETGSQNGDTSNVVTGVTSHLFLKADTSSDTTTTSPSMNQMAFTLGASTATFISTGLGFMQAKLLADAGASGGSPSDVGVESLSSDDVPFLGQSGLTPAAQMAPFTSVASFLQTICNITSCACEIVVLIMGWPPSDDTNKGPVYSSYIRGAASLIKGIDSTISIIGITSQSSSIPEALSMVAPILSPYANMGNSVCGMIELCDSDKKSSDFVAFGTSIAGGGAAICDFWTVLSAEGDQLETAAVAAGVSLVLNTLCLPVITLVDGMRREGM